MQLGHQQYHLSSALQVDDDYAPCEEGMRQYAIQFAEEYRLFWKRHRTFQLKGRMAPYCPRESRAFSITFRFLYPEPKSLEIHPASAGHSSITTRLVGSECLNVWMEFNKFNDWIGVSKDGAHSSIKYIHVTTWSQRLRRIRCITLLGETKAKTVFRKCYSFLIHIWWCCRTYTSLCSLHAWWIEGINTHFPALSDSISSLLWMFSPVVISPFYCSVSSRNKVQFTHSWRS